MRSPDTCLVIRGKGQIMDNFKAHIGRVSNKFGRILHILCSKKGSEYIINDVTEYLKTECMGNQKTIICTPKNKGIIVIKINSLV